MDGITCLTCLGIVGAAGLLFLVYAIMHKSGLISDGEQTIGGRKQ